MTACAVVPPSGDHAFSFRSITNMNSLPHQLRVLSPGATSRKLSRSLGSSSLDFAQLDKSYFFAKQVRHAPTWCWSLVAVMLLAPMVLGVDRPLYETDFFEFPVGDDQLVGNEGWLGTHVGQGLHGIDANAYEGLGNSVFLGFTPPSDPADGDLVSIYHPLEAATAATDTVRFQVQMGISETIEGGYDAFNFAFFDAADGFLAAISFDTNEIDFGIWTDDGETVSDTGELFLTDYVHLLSVTIRLGDNRWSADLDGITVFEDIVFTSRESSSGLQVGGIAAEWEIQDINDPGDNWILIDDWYLAVLDDSPAVAADESFRITAISQVGEQGVRFTWPAEAGIAYQVETSEDTMVWHAMGAVVEGMASATSLTHTDPTALAADARFYRVRLLGSTTSD